MLTSSLALPLIAICHINQDTLATLSVVLYDDVNYEGAAYSSHELAPGVCTTLPSAFLGKPESVKIATGYSCTFYASVLAPLTSGNFPRVI